MLRNSSGLVTDLKAAIFVVSPDSMMVEISVSHTIFCTKLRSSSTQNTMRSRLLIAWNVVATSKFDPRSAIGRFFQRKRSS